MTSVSRNPTRLWKRLASTGPATKAASSFCCQTRDSSSAVGPVWSEIGAVGQAWVRAFKRCGRRTAAVLSIAPNRSGADLLAASSKSRSAASKRGQKVFGVIAQTLAELRQLRRRPVRVRTELRRADPRDA